MSDNQYDYDKNHDRVVAMVYYADDSNYVNLGASSAGNREIIYWRCLSVLANTLRSFGKHAGRILVFTNIRPPPPYDAALAASHVEFITIPFDHRPQREFYASFIGALHLLDAIQWASSNISPSDSILFLDPDCLVVGNIDLLFQKIEEVGTLCYGQAYPLHRVVNGLSRIQIWQLEEECFGAQRRVDTPRWLGGELLGLRGDVARCIAPALSSGWAANMRIFEQGRTKYNTEEQFLSGAFHALDLPWFDAGDGFVKRIWTTSRHRNYSSEDLHLPIWHLPAEKTRGFVTAYNAIFCAKRPLSRNEQLDVFSAWMGMRNDWLREAIYLARIVAQRLRGIVTGRVNQYP